MAFILGSRLCSQTSINFYFLRRKFMVQNSDNIADFFARVDQSLVLSVSGLQLLFKFGNFYFHADDVEVLISEDGLDSCHVDIRFFVGMTMMSVLGEWPGLDLSFHFAVLLLHVPYSGAKGTVLVFDLVYRAFERVVLVPYQILSTLVAVEIDVRMENIMVRHYLFS